MDKCTSHGDSPFTKWSRLISPVRGRVVAHPPWPAHRKTSDRCRLRDSLRNTCLTYSIFRNRLSMQSTERLRISQGSEETEVSPPSAM